MKPSERLRTVEAVIISHKNFGEADRMVNMFSREGGKIRGLAKGVRKMGSRKAAYLEPFMQSKVVLARGKSFWIITQADAIKQHLSIRDSLRKTAAAAYVMELADRFSIEEEPSPAVFRLIVNALEWVDGLDDIYTAMRLYEFRMLDQAGFKPELRNCTGCGKEIVAEDQYFSANQGGVICPNCSPLYHHSRIVAVDTLRYLRHIQRSTFTAIRALDIPQKDRKEISAIMDHYISSIVERRLHAPEFMRQVNHGIGNKSQVKLEKEKGEE